MAREAFGWSKKAGSKQGVTPEDVLLEVRSVAGSVATIASDLHHIRTMIDRHADSLEEHTGKIAHIQGRMDQQLQTKRD